MIIRSTKYIYKFEVVLYRIGIALFIFWFIRFGCLACCTTDLLLVSSSTAACKVLCVSASFFFARCTSCHLLAGFRMYDTGETSTKAEAELFSL